MTTGWLQGIADLLLKGPAWVWTALFVGSAVRLLAPHTKIGIALGSEAWSGNVVAGFITASALLVSASYLIFRLVPYVHTGVKKRTAAKAQRLKEQRMGELLGTLPEAARNLVAHVIFSGGDKVQIGSDADHVAAVQLQQAGVGQITPGVLSPSFYVSTEWRRFLRKNAIADSPRPD